MPVKVFDTYENLSWQCANHLINLAVEVINPVICVASGDTQKGMYKELVGRVTKENIDVSPWYFIGLDEWAGMNGDDEGSCRYHLNNQLFRPLHIEENKIIFFDGREEDLTAQCDKIEDAITLLGGIDVAVLGLGLNGHIGMNEPGTLPSVHSHIAEIALQTQEVGQKYFMSNRKITHGVTLGLATIIAAKNIMLLVTGKKKAPVVKSLLESKPTIDLPASFITNMNNTTTYLDSEAASLTRLYK